MLARDVYMDKVGSDLCNQALIGRLEYCSMGKKDWVDWATIHWKPLLTYLSTISLLAKGWLVFVFLEDAHASLILDSLWRIGKGSLVLSRWHPAFDPLRGRIIKRHLWVPLPAFPFPLWSRDFLEGLANTIGCFMVV